MMIRTILAILGGLAVGVIGIMLLEMVGHSVYPPPPVTDSASYKIYFDNSPLGALLFVVVAHGLGTFAGVVAALKIEKSNKIAAFIVAVLFLVATLADLSNLLLKNIFPPIWFIILDPLAVLIVLIFVYKQKIEIE